VVILRFSGADDVGSTVIEVLRVYANELSTADCRLAVVTDSGPAAKDRMAPMAAPSRSASVGCRWISGWCSGRRWGIGPGSRAVR
jgi:hypothetical protein